MAFSGAPRPRISFVPPAPLRYDQVWMARLIEGMTKFLGNTITTVEAAPYVMLLSPSAKVFRVTVSDTGVLTATEVPQGDASA